MKPYLQSDWNRKRHIFNYRLSRARRIVENVFGILATHFGIFRKPVNLLPCKVKGIVLVCCYLHNFLKSTKEVESYISYRVVDFKSISSGEIIEGTWRKDGNDFLQL
jgi:hypothetical protein